MATAVAQGWDVFSTVNGASAGQRVIVCGDDWTSQDSAFTLDSVSHTLFFQQCATWMGGGPTDFGRGNMFTPIGDLITALTADGHTISAQETMSSDYATQLAKLEEYVAWFIHPRSAAELGNATAWIDWINGGGRVMFFAGSFSAHTQINTVIGGYDLNLLGPRKCPTTNELTDYSGHGHDILTGVGDLYFLLGEQVEKSSPSSKTELFIGDNPTDGSVTMLATYDGEIP